MGELNTLTGALSLSIVAMSIVFGVLGGLALLMVLIKYIALVIERAGQKVAEVEVKEERKPSLEAEKVSEEKEEVEDLREVAVIAAAIGAISHSTGSPLRVWRISGPVKTFWRESGKIESMIGGNENE